MGLSTDLENGLNGLKTGTDFLSMVDLSEDQMRTALAVFEKLGAEHLKPVFDQLNGKVTYDELRILRFHYLRNPDHPSEDMLLF